MKVKELIEALQKMNPEVSVTVGVYGGCGGYEDTYEIFDTDEYEAGKNYDGSASICVDKGCMCHAGTKTSKFTNRPQSPDQYWLGLDAAFESVSKSFEWYRKELERIGNAKDYDEHIRVKELSAGKRSLENALRDIGKLKRNGKKETP